MNILEMITRDFQKTALVEGNERVSFGDMINFSLQYSKVLKNKGAGKESNILVLVPLSINMYKALMASWSIGAVTIFIDFSRGFNFVNESINILKPDLIICNNKTSLIINIYKNIKNIPFVNIDKFKVNREKKLYEGFLRLGDDAPAIMTFTSGSTGFPKVAVRSHGFLINQYKVLSKYLEFGKEEVDLATLPVFTLANFAAGLTTVLPPKNYLKNVKKLAQIMRKEKVSRIISSPYLMEQLIKYDDNLTELRHIYLGGAPVFPSTIEKIKNSKHISGLVEVIYGSTEAEPIAHMRTKDAYEKTKDKIMEGFGLPAGRIVDEVSCKIVKVNSDGCTEVYGEIGEIIVTGDTVLKGYLNGKGDKENKLNIDGVVWHRTGDLGRIDEEGNLWLLGRSGQELEDEKGILYPFAVTCQLDIKFGIRGIPVIINSKRCIVIEKRDLKKAPKENILDILKDKKVEEVITVKKIPMDKRHNAKVDYNMLLKLIDTK